MDDTTTNDTDDLKSVRVGMAHESVSRAEEFVSAAKELREYVRRKSHALDAPNPVAGRFDRALSAMPPAEARRDYRGGR